MQTIANANLSVDAKFDSSVTQQFQEQGVVVEQDSTHYIYAAIVQNFFQTAFVVKTVSGATVTTNANVEIYNKPSIILRVARFGNSWTFGYSYDGLRWTAAAAATTTMTVACGRLRRELRRRLVARVQNEGRLLRQLDRPARDRRRCRVADRAGRARHQPLVRIERDVRRQGSAPAVGERAR